MVTCTSGRQKPSSLSQGQLNKTSIFVVICTDIVFHLVMFAWASYSFARVTEFLHKSHALVIDLSSIIRYITASLKLHFMIHVDHTFFTGCVVFKWSLKLTLTVQSMKLCVHPFIPNTWCIHTPSSSVPWFNRSVELITHMDHSPVHMRMTILIFACSLQLGNVPSVWKHPCRNNALCTRPVAMTLGSPSPR